MQKRVGEIHQKVDNEKRQFMAIVAENPLVTVTTLVWTCKEDIQIGQTSLTRLHLM